MDTYDEAWLGDNIPATARDVTSLMGDYGVERVEDHTLHVVDGTNGDVDWVKFAVSTDDVSVDKTSFLFRTQSPYGPYATSSFSYTTGYLSGSSDSPCVASNDDDVWRKMSRDSELVFRPSAAGTYYVRIRP